MTLFCMYGVLFICAIVIKSARNKASGQKMHASIFLPYHNGNYPQKFVAKLTNTGKR